MRKVLIADDDQTMILLLKTLLNLEGYRTSTLLDKKGDVLEIIRSESPDYLIMDINLGTRDGIELARELRRNREFDQMRIIMVSGMDKAKECREAGANDFLLKPYMPEDLFNCLRADR
jgi:DNA-binding response OmpR family regulator